MTRRLPLWLQGLNIVGLALWVFIATFPFVWMFLISFRAPVDAFSALGPESLLVETHVERHDGARAFLRSLKAIGAGTAKPHGTYNTGSCCV